MSRLGYDRAMVARGELFSSVIDDDDLAANCIDVLTDCESSGADAEGVATLLQLLKITGVGLANLWRRVGRNPENLALLVQAVYDGSLRAYILRDAAKGLPVDLAVEVERLTTGEMGRNPGEMG